MAGSLLLGVNLAGAEFGSNVPGVFGTDYTYPTHAEIDYYAAKGMGVIRLPFLWERVQRSEFAALDATELGRLDDVVNYATGKGLKIEIEPHDYGYGFGALIGSAQTPNSAFADLWGKLAGHFQSNSGVIFGLMNEPHDQSASAWLGSANAAIAAIRGAGASQEILVPGSYWDGAWTWVSSDNDTIVGAGVQDPAHNFAFEVHQYLDADGSGTHAGAVSATIGVERLTAITQWAEATGNHLFLGEVGVTTDQTSLTAFDGMLTYMQQHTGAWQGVTYWAGGPWWGNYMFSIEPQNGVDKPQMGILVQHLSAPSGDYNGTSGSDTFSANGNLLHLYGNDGNDQLSVVGNQNQLSGGNGDDALSANGAGNSLHGDAGNDMLTAAGGMNQLYGGTGNDGYSIDNAGDVVIENASEGSDTVYATVHFGLPANVENLVLQGGADLQGYGNGDANTITGNGGSNLLDGRGGADVMLGGAGNDTYFVDNAGDQVVENAGGGSDAVFSTAHFALSANVETLVLQGGADLQGYGNDLANALYGNTGNNLLNGGAGADVMFGGAGNDVYFVDGGDGVIENANEGNDSVFSTTHFALSANVENLVLQGNTDLQGYGNDLANALYGNTGNNILNGEGGADIMFGGAGNDAYFVDGGDGVIENANEGNDTVFSTTHYALSANVENLVLQGSADLQGYGNGLANAIYGNSGNNLIDGGTGADMMFGGIGNDAYFVDDPGDAVFENPGEGNDAVFSTVNFRLAANVETLVLQGGADLQGIGNSQSNMIYGNSGNNLIDGGAGADVLTGNAGNDTFVFSAGQAAGDMVVDFTGNGAAPGDSLQFVGYGSGATFTNIDSTHWQINFNNGASHEIITFMNGAAIDPTDVLFS